MRSGLSDSRFAVEDTESVFWSNLEAGLSLLAVNLPSLWAYVNKASPESIIASIRSIITLHSLRSNGSSNRSRSHVRLPDRDTSGPPSIMRAGAHPMQRPVESHPLHNVEERTAGLSMPDDVIEIT